MACSNAKLIRFALGIKQGTCTDGWNTTGDTVIEALKTVIPAEASPTTPRILANITKVGGISLGEEGEVEIPNWDVVGLISDGKRKLTNLSLSARLTKSLQLGTVDVDDTVGILAHLYAKRHALAVNYYLYITDRDWNVQYYYKYIDATMKKWTQEDQELGAPKLGLIDTDIAPQDVELYDCNHNAIVTSQPPTGSNLKFCV